VRMLGSPNQWVRMTAQRLLVERGNSAVVPALNDAVRRGSPLARLHSLCALDGLGALEEEALLIAMEDPVPGIRIHAVRLSESRLAGSDKLQSQIGRLGNDPDI